MQDGFRDGVVHGGREGKGKGEGLCADSQQIRTPGPAIIELAAHQQEKRRGAGMGKQGVALAGAGSDGLAMYEPG